MEHYNIKYNIRGFMEKVLSPQINELVDIQEELRARKDYELSDKVRKIIDGLRGSWYLEYEGLEGWLRPKEVIDRLKRVSR